MLREEQIMMLQETLGRLSIKADETVSSRFLMFYDMLCERNRVMNLTAITEYPDVLEKHFLDSLSLVKVLDVSGKSVIDLGTGAGFPGIPLKIVFPDTEMLLADSLKKRILFLDEVIEKCSLQKIRTVHGRAEDLGKKGSQLREEFEVCVSRAVANLSSLSEYCLPFVHVGGCFVAYKSGDCETEINRAAKAIRILGGEVENTCSFMLPGTDLKRTLVVIRKNSPTPLKYPRKAGLPGKQPL